VLRPTTWIGLGVVYSTAGGISSFMAVDTEAYRVLSIISWPAGRPGIQARPRRRSTSCR